MICKQWYNSLGQETTPNLFLLENYDIISIEKEKRVLLLKRPCNTGTKSVTKDIIMTTIIKPITLDFAKMTNVIATSLESEIIPTEVPLYYCSCETMNIMRLLDKYHLTLKASEHYVTKDWWWQEPQYFDDLTNEATLYYCITLIALGMTLSFYGVQKNI